ncbi:MAG: hypothetical protein K2G94_07630 [Muribaculaceae bacterium]|nr:hypothetical protein [Muribaculaceae bacterium]MDE5972601.1 hypothetical protein [Muribaculaceae bacterium]MDE6462457.1 hypothetical protein [Muribaculaceae bacterium]MDE6509177.1 hypothetical protein [Muribaculaceae bacterium]
MQLNFLDKMDNAIFRRVNPTHESHTGGSICTAFIASVALSLLVFVCQMCNVNETALNVIAGVGLAAIFGWVIYVSLDTIKAFGGWGGRIGYCVYLIVMTNIAFFLAMWATLILLAGLLLYVIFKVFFSSDNKKKGTIRYSDGTEEEADVETGICGEQIFTGKDSGNTYTKP